VSAKLTLEICINNGVSNSRLTAVGRQATAADTIHRPVSRLFFFFLPTFDEKTTELHLNTEKLTETVLHLNLGHFVWFVCVCVCVCSFVLFYVSPLMRQLQNKPEAPSPGLEADGQTPKLLRLKLLAFDLEVYFLFFIHFILFYFSFFSSFTYFLFLFLSLFLLFFIFNPLSVSHAFSPCGSLVTCLILFISLKLFLFVSLVFFSYLIICFSLFL
jgi:hypothetical protein